MFAHKILRSFVQPLELFKQANINTPIKKILCLIEKVTKMFDLLESWNNMKLIKH